ncbi:MAG: TolC family protein, partial [Bacteroidales bacterium]
GVPMLTALLLLPCLLAAGTLTGSETFNLGAGPPIAVTEPQDPASGQGNDPLSLAQAVTLAQARSPQTAAARAQLVAATDARRLVPTLPNPTFEIRGENLGGAGWGAGVPIEPGLSPLTDFFAVATQPIELGGKRTARRGVADADRGVAAAAATTVSRAVTLETTRIYLEAVRARSLARSLAAHREELSALLDAMKRRVAEGYAAEADLLKFQAEAARIDLQLARTALDRDRAAAALGAVLGLEAPVAPSRLVDPAPIAAPEGDPRALAEAALAAHPAVAAARAQVERARQSLAFERALRVPDPAFSGGYKRTNGSDTAVFGVVVPLPLFDGNGRNIALAVGEEQAAGHALDDTSARALAGTRSAIERAQALQARARLVDDELLKPAAMVRDSARSAFREGASDVLRLLDAERVYLDAHRDALELKLDAFFSAAEARLALGQEIFR